MLHNEKNPCQGVTGTPSRRRSPSQRLSGGKESCGVLWRESRTGWKGGNVCLSFSSAKTLVFERAGVMASLLVSDSHLLG